MATTETPLKDLVGRYTNDIRYDSHSVEARITRSFAKACLQEKGKESLSFIADEMESIFSSVKIDYDLLMAYVMLICGIIEDHKLAPPPYSSNVKYGKQRPQAWIKYCRNNG